MKRVTRWLRSVVDRLRVAAPAGTPPVTVRRRRRRAKMPLLWEG